MALSVAHSTSHAHHLCKRFNHVEKIMLSVKDEIADLTPRPDLDSCPLRQLEEQVGSLTKNLSDLARDTCSRRKKRKIC